MSVHPGASSGPKNWTLRPLGGCVVDGSTDGWGEGGQDDLAAFAGDPQHPVPVFLAEVTDVGAAGFEDPQAEEPEHRNEGEVVRVWGEAGGGEHGLELQVGQPQSG